MTIEDKNILWLDLFEFLTYGKKIKLLNSINKSENLREKFLNNKEIKDTLSNEEFNKMALCLSDEYLNRHLREYEKDNVQLITFNNQNYPLKHECDVSRFSCFTEYPSITSIISICSLY